METAFGIELLNESFLSKILEQKLDSTEERRLVGALKSEG